ncbi:MAG TPA: hypothetical protein VLI71_18090 [Gammaproteobacteria bacterium]|nr:hypothetical protein [Gammaproteobacteria bacterium]
MSANYNRFVFSLIVACAMAAIAMFTALQAYAAGPRLVADTFTATTANMTPAGLALRIQVIEWQEAEARGEAVATLAAGADAPTPLAKLPTVGYVWPGGSPVGYSVKYAYRTQQPNGGERVTLVTDKRLGSYDFKGWSVASPAVANEAPYSVIELDLNGSGTGTGTLSLAGEVVVDEQAGTVALKPGAPSLLTNVKREAARP